MKLENTNRSRIWAMRRPIFSSSSYPEQVKPWPLVTSEIVTKQQKGPMILEWQSSKIVLDDFIWPGLFSDLVARKEVSSKLISNFSGARAIPVEMKSARTKPNQSFWDRNPYEVIWIDFWVTANEERSTFHRYTLKDGRPAIEIVGVEEYYNSAFHNQAEFPGSVPIGRGFFHAKRQASAGIFVEKDLLNGRQFFRIKQIPMLLLCTDGVAAFIKQSNFGNIELLEYGELA